LTTFCTDGFNCAEGCLHRRSRIQKQERESHAEGSRASAVHTRAVQDLHRSVRDTSEFVRSVFSPGMVGLGIGAFGAAEAIEGTAQALLAFATRSRDLHNMSVETGLTVDQLARLEALAPRIGSSVDAMDAGLRTFTFNINQLHMQKGPLNEFFARFAILFGDLYLVLTKTFRSVAMRSGAAQCGAGRCGA
jgi:hypothetical protein